ncbi:MAG: hypothetical protein PHO56_03975 [Patescibacteria group bacterium]|nr:hypothetical protein [Patescibacteria group bacterium]
MSLKSFFGLIDSILVMMIGMAGYEIYNCISPNGGGRVFVLTILLVIGGLLVFVLLAQLVKKIILRLEVISLIEPTGTMLFRAKKGEVFFRGRFDGNNRDELKVADIFHGYFYLPMKIKINASNLTIIPLGASGRWEICLQAENFLVDAKSGDCQEAMKLFYRYGNLYSAQVQMNKFISDALKETVSECLKNTGEKGSFQKMELSFNAMDIFLAKARAALKNELYEFAGNNFNFSVTVNYID